MQNQESNPKPTTDEQPSDEGLSSSALFGCPFCGESAEMDYSEMERRAGIAAAVKCTSESCRTFGPDGHNDEEAARKWNERKTQWLNIESAPKDGTEILATNGHYCFVCHWDDVTAAYYTPNRQFGWATRYNDEYMKYDEEEPTHWTILPSLPNAESCHGRNET